MGVRILYVTLGLALAVALTVGVARTSASDEWCLLALCTLATAGCALLLILESIECLTGTFIDQHVRKDDG